MRRKVAAEGRQGIAPPGIGQRALSPINPLRFSLRRLRNGCESPSAAQPKTRVRAEATDASERVQTDRRGERVAETTHPTLDHIILSVRGGGLGARRQREDFSIRWRYPDLDPWIPARLETAKHLLTIQLASTC